MQVTFIVKLIVAIIGELKAAGFEINSTDVNEENADIVFTKDYKYNVSIFTEKSDAEYLKITGKRQKQIYVPDVEVLRNWLSELQSDDRIVIQHEHTGNNNFGKITHNYDIKYNINDIDKEAVLAIAKDIIGDIIKH